MSCFLKNKNGRKHVMKDASIGLKGLPLAHSDDLINKIRTEMNYTPSRGRNKNLC